MSRMLGLSLETLMVDKWIMQRLNHPVYNQIIDRLYDESSKINLQERRELSVKNGLVLKART